jgi:hypothetical protein
MSLTEQQSVTKIITLTHANYVTPKTGAKDKVLASLNKLVSVLYGFALKVHLHIKFLSPN